MKGITCGFAHKALTSIDEAEEGAYLDLNHRLVALLKEKGLISAYSTWFYHEMLSNAEKVKTSRIRLNTIRKEATSHEKAVNTLENNLKSTWAYSSREVQEMRGNLVDRKQQRGERLAAAENLEEKLERLEAMPAPAEDYRLTIDGQYVMLTDKGTMWLATLSGRLEEFGNAPMEAFEGVLEDFESRIDAYCARAVEALELMGSRGFGKHNPQTIDCAVRLATSEYTVQEAYSRMRSINDFLHDKSEWHDGVKTYERLIPAAAIAIQPGNIGMLKEELIEAFKTLTDKEYYKNSFVWWLAAEVMKLGRFNVGMNIERYEEIRKELGKTGWGGLSWDTTQRHTCYMAANLTRGAGPAEELTKKLRIQQLKLTDTGRTKSDDLGTASLVLLDSEIPLEERTKRFVEVWKEMEAYGWGKYHTFYPAAAALTVMPYSVAENVMWLDTTIKRLKEYGLHDAAENREDMKNGLTYRALAILTVAYSGQVRQEVMPHFIVCSDDALVKSTKP